MIAFLVVVAAAGFLLWLLGGVPQLRVRKVAQSQLTAQKITELTDYAARLRASNNYTGAEKVYLEILKLDHRHAATYSRLGTLYSAMKNYGDAIECFVMASQLSPSGPTFYNLGLSYYENRNYIKAVAALEKAIMFDPTVQRYVGLAKVFKKLEDRPRMITALEQAAGIEESARVLWLLFDAYMADDREQDAQAILVRIKKVAPRDPRLKLATRQVVKRS